VSAGYSRTQIALHWLTAGLVIVQLTFNEGARIGFREHIEGSGEGLGDALGHVVIGSAILLLTAFRLVVRCRRGAPAPHAELPEFLKFLAASVHILLYALLIAVPVTGAAAWVFREDAFAVLHEAGRLLLVTVILGHALGALVEHFVMRNDTLTRMLRASG
jgi:cytochrome b561